VKVCADTNSQINLQLIPISIHDLSQVLALGPLPNNDVETLPRERKVYVVDGVLVKFKCEVGKTGDIDRASVGQSEYSRFHTGATIPYHI
jgi:hypothetical protein